jgi:hypothetical protein
MKVVFMHHGMAEEPPPRGRRSWPPPLELLPYHLYHRLQCHLRLALRILHHVLRDFFGGPGLAVRSRPWSRPDSRICSSGAYGRSSRARCGGRAGGRGPRQKV